MEEDEPTVLAVSTAKEVFPAEHALLPHFNTRKSPLVESE